MTDVRLPKLTGALLVAIRDQVDHLIGGGLVDKERLRATLAPPEGQSLSPAGELLELVLSGDDDA